MTTTVGLYRARPRELTPDLLFVDKLKGVLLEFPFRMGGGCAGIRA